jgi:hypothetical protein
VRYAVRHAAGDRSSTAVTIVNTGAAPVDGWQLTFAVPVDQQLLRGWAGVWTQDGRLIRARGADLPVGGSVATGFDATYRDVTALPAGFELNGTACRSVLTVAAPPGPSVQPAGATRRPTGRSTPAGGGPSAATTDDSGRRRSGGATTRSKAGKDKPSKSKGKGKGKGKKKG